MRYASIRKLDISNGEGIGVSLFVQGCPFHCYNCFNPDTWDFNGGKEWTEETKGVFFKLIDRPYIKRVSLLGGEPLVEENLEDIYNLVKEIKSKFPNKTIWLYTGYEFEKILNNPFRTKIAELCDVIVDGRYIDSLADITYKWAGSTNQRVIDVKKSLEQNSIVLYTQ